MVLSFRLHCYMPCLIQVNFFFDRPL